VNGFLAALVARAERRLPVLERRPRSLFEPVAGAVATHLTEDEPQQRDADGARSSLAAMPFAARPEARDPPSPDHGLHAEPAAWRRGLLLPDPITAIAPPAATQLHEERPAITRAREASAAPDERPVARRALAVTPRIEASSAVHARARHEHAQGTGSLTAAPAPMHATPQAGALQSRPAATTRPALLLARAQAPFVTRRESPPAAAATLAPVQISIGRVEIRAVQAAADKPRAVGPAAPRLSLDDYLRRRNGAAR
jgi:hypothetical protein